MFVNPGLWCHWCAKKETWKESASNHLKIPENPVSSHHPPRCLRLCYFSFPGYWIEHVPLWAFTRLQANHSICVTKWHTLQTLTLIRPHLVLLKVPNHFHLLIFPISLVPCTTVFNMLTSFSWYFFRSFWKTCLFEASLQPNCPILPSSRWGTALGRQGPSSSQVMVVGKFNGGGPKYWLVKHRNDKSESERRRFLLEK